MQPDPTREIIDKCKRESRIRYQSTGSTFFRPRLRGINHLQVGKSKIIDSPLAIMIEWLFEQFRRLRRAWQRFIAGLFPRHPAASRRTPRQPARRAHHLCRRSRPRSAHPQPAPRVLGPHLLVGWRKISEGRTDAEGCFALPFPLRAARRLAIRSLRLEIHQTTRVYFEDDSPRFHYDLFKAIPVVKSDLIGMDYNLRAIPLDYWLYDPRAVTPRALVDFDLGLPETYATGRSDAIIEQAIPLEITKIKHLEQSNSPPTR